MGFKSFVAPPRDARRAMSSSDADAVTIARVADAALRRARRALRRRARECRALRRALARARGRFIAPRARAATARARSTADDAVVDDARRRAVGGNAWVTRPSVATAVNARPVPMTPSSTEG